MHWLAELDFFPRTIENRFVFSLFDFLLSGIVLLAIVREWRVREDRPSQPKNHLLFVAFLCLGASFGLAASYEGVVLFLRRHLEERLFETSVHLLMTLGFAAMAVHNYQTRQPRVRLRHQPLLWMIAALNLGFLLWQLYSRFSAEVAVDFLNIVLLGLLLLFFCSDRVAGKRLGTIAGVFMLLGAVLHWIFALAQGGESRTFLWNLEQFSWAASLFVFALAIGEASQDLFARVFVRLQLAFILLASVMILVMTQTERNDYLAGVRGRSEQVAEFTRAHVDYFRQRSEQVTAAVEQEDFLRRITLAFANLPELKLVRITAGDQVVTFDIAENGRIQKRVGLRLSGDALLSPDDYLMIQRTELQSGGAVEFYGSPEFLNRYIRKRIVLMFSLFTGMVVFSTVLIGLVVRGASATIRQQAAEIEAQQQKLLQASKLAAIGELAAGVAHEVNNPATTILSRASFLASQDGKFCASDQEDLDAIVNGAQRIAQITRGLLTFSRPQALSMRPVSVEHVVRAGLHSLSDSLLRQHVSLETVLSLGLPPVLADELSLERALENILRNAVDAMPDGGTLLVRADANGSGTLKLEISDTGTGIEPDKLGRIFDPFFTTKEVGKGTGLGLSIAHGIIQEHKGTIRAESTPGTGTRFVITLPTTEASL